MGFACPPSDGKCCSRGFTSDASGEEMPVPMMTGNRQDAECFPLIQPSSRCVVLISPIWPFGNSRRVILISPIWPFGMLKGYTLASPHLAKNANSPSKGADTLNPLEMVGGATGMSPATFRVVECSCPLGFSGAPPATRRPIPENGVYNCAPCRSVGLAVLSTALALLSTETRVWSERSTHGKADRKFS